MTPADDTIAPVPATSGTRARGVSVDQTEGGPRCGLARVERGFPVLDLPGDAPPFGPEDVQRALAAE